jgi:hypothetical protein
MNDEESIKLRKDSYDAGDDSKVNLSENSEKKFDEHKVIK